MKLSLYEIEKSQIQLIDQLIENCGELTLEIEEALKINSENLTTKGTNYGFIIKQLTSECSIIDAEIDRLSDLKKSRTKSIEYLKNNLTMAMQLFEVDKIESPLLKISFRASESVEIDDVDSIPAEYMVTKTTTQPDKVKLKSAIKAGELIIGAHIQVNKNLQIK
jgi:hypothetical protein